MLRTRIKQNPRTHGTARGHHTWPDAFHLARGLQRLTPEEDGVDAAGDTLEDRRSTGNWGRRREDPIGERARTPSIPDNAFTAIATSPCKCSTGTKPSVRKDTFNVRPRLSLGRTCVIQAPFRSTVRVSLRASAADTTLPPRPGRQSSPHAQRARDDRAAGSQARGTLKKEKPCTAGKKKRADLRAQAMPSCGRGRTSPVRRATALQLQVISSHSCAAVSPCWHVHSGADD